MPSRAGSPSLSRQLGARIRTLREEAGLTQETLAWESGVSKATLSLLESGRRMASVPVLVALAKRLRVEIADLLGFPLTRPRLQLLDAARRGDANGVRSALRRLGLD